MMKLPWHALPVVTAAALALAACQSGGPAEPVTRGPEIYFNDFSQSASFEEGTYDGATLRVRDGVYRIDVTQGDAALWWGQWGEPVRDVIIDVDVTQSSQRPETVAGVMCRVRGSVGLARTPDPELAAIAAGTAEATPDATAESTPEATAMADEQPPAGGQGDGYLFLIQGNGTFAIMEARGRDVQPLVDWTPSAAIQPVPGTNHLRAVCDGTYLALYINDQFAGQATDDSYQEGQIGLAAAAANRLGVRVDFDNLSVAAPAEPS